MESMTYEKMIKQEFPDIVVMRKSRKPLTKEAYKVMRKLMLEFSKKS